VAQKISAVLTVDLEEARGLEQRAEHVAEALGRIEAACGQPRVALDDVRCNQCVLEVEGSDMALWIEDLLAHPAHAVGRL